MTLVISPTRVNETNALQCEWMYRTLPKNTNKKQQI